MSKLDPLELVEVLEKLIGLVFKGGAPDRLTYARKAVDALAVEVPHMREACRLLRISRDVGFVSDADWAAYNKWLDSDKGEP